MVIEALLQIAAKKVVLSGKDLDIVIPGPGKSEKFQAENQHVKAGWTPYEGMDKTGKI